MVLRSPLWVNCSWGTGSHPAPSTHTPAHLPTPEARSLMAWTGFSLHHRAFIRLSLFCLFSIAGQSSICVHSHRTAKPRHGRHRGLGGEGESERVPGLDIADRPCLHYNILGLFWAVSEELWLLHCLPPMLERCRMSSRAKAPTYRPLFSTWRLNSAAV